VGGGSGEGREVEEVIRGQEDSAVPPSGSHLGVLPFTEEMIFGEGPCIGNMFHREGLPGGLGERGGELL